MRDKNIVGDGVSSASGRRGRRQGSRRTPQSAWRKAKTSQAASQSGRTLPEYKLEGEGRRPRNAIKQS
ncbi:hypothetical protein E2C01_066217 [Portunus trituberculatus]|uniref:Uncharacterized protein n=1 Tax=Portunus trituberculatus TaxID=210409 RepID=A0A5B7HPP2_PORTR|nr:hypothetical protein [Portunus trituberculatus]